MSRKRESPEVRKSESPEEVNNAVQKDSFGEFGMSNAEGENNSAIGIPHSEIKEPVTTHNSPLTTMEVHHHPDVEKKGLKEYVLEGLMIFLAVMMGFFAESIRENIGDNEHVAQLCSQLIQDMKTDTINLNKVISKETVYMKTDDSLFAVLQQPLEKMDTKELQHLVNDCFYYRLFHSSTGAIGAIKSELRLKQFSNTRIADYIANYEGDVEVIKKGEELEESLLKNLEAFMRAHFTMANMNAIMNSKNNQAVNGKLRNITQNDLEQLGVDIRLLKTIRNGGIEEKNGLKQKAVKMMQFVKSQYDLKDE
jgi:hypothetical protein